MSNNKTAKKRIILALFSVILVVIMTVCAVQVRRKVLYDSVVGECSNQELTDRWRSKGEAYDIEVNSKGMVIFKSSVKAGIGRLPAVHVKKRRFMPKGF